jgi:hypothetical protein
LAEGLYALVGGEDPSVLFNDQLGGATRHYWSRFIESRREVITDTKITLRRFIDWDSDNDQVCSALDSLEAAESQLATITADICVNFLDAWRDDLNDWQRFASGIKIGSMREAMDFLQLKTWTLAEFGAAVVDSETNNVHIEAADIDHGVHVIDFDAPAFHPQASRLQSEPALVTSQVL